MILRTSIDNAIALWPRVADLLRPALALVSTHTTADVKAAVLTGQCQLWLDIDGVTPMAALVTEFVSYPVGLFVRAWVIGSDPDRRLDTDGFFDVLDEWRSKAGAVGFEAIGRHGWLRKVPGAKVEGLVLRYMP